MYKAKYISEDGKENKIVNAKDITPKQNEEIYRGYLYCNCDKCNAILVYNERQKDRFVRYFSTLPGSMHRRGCPNEVLHKGSRARAVKVSGGNVNLSDDHIEETLSNSYKKFYEKVHPSDKSSGKRKYTPRKKNSVPLVYGEETATLRIEGIPVTSGKGRKLTMGKEPFVYKKEVSEVNQRDIGNTREFHGLVEDIRIMNY